MAAPTPIPDDSGASPGVRAFAEAACRRRFRLYLRECPVPAAPTRADLERAVTLGLDPGWLFSQLGWDAPEAGRDGYHADRVSALDRYRRAVEAAYREHVLAPGVDPESSWGEFFRAAGDARKVFLRASADAMADAFGLTPTP